MWITHGLHKGSRWGLGFRALGLRSLKLCGFGENRPFFLGQCVCVCTATSEPETLCCLGRTPRSRDPRTVHERSGCFLQAVLDPSPETVLGLPVVLRVGLWGMLQNSYMGIAGSPNVTQNPKSNKRKAYTLNRNPKPNKQKTLHSANSSSHVESKTPGFRASDQQFRA